MFAVNDPYLGGTHFNDVRIIRPDLPRGPDHRLRPGQRALGRRRRIGAGLVRHQRQGALRRGPAHPARAAVGSRRVPARRRPADLLQHPHAHRLRGRHARPGRGDAGLRARDPAAGRALRRRHRRDGVRRGAELRRAAHARPHRGAARCGDGDGRLPRPRPGRRRGPDPDPRQDDHLGRPRALRPERLAPGRRLVPQLGLRRHHLGRLRGYQDVLPRRAAQLGLLPRRRRSTSGPRAASSTRPGRSRSPASAPGPTRRS